MTILLPFIFFLGSCLLMAIKTAINRLSYAELEAEFEKSKFRSFFFRFLIKLFPYQRAIPIQDFLSLTGLITVAAYGVTGAVYLFPLEPLWFLLSIVLLMGVFLLTYVFFHLFASYAPYATLKLFSLLASLYLMVFFPVLAPILWIESKIAPGKRPKETRISSEKLRKRLLELLEEPEIQEILDPQDKHLVRSIANFGKYVVREIMVPRVDVICLPEHATVAETIKIFMEEGYSRIPVYKESIDHITGVLLYKAVMEFAMGKSKEILEKTTIGPLMTSIIYAPENKKIQELFQEMRNQKIHAAIVVNEYGCMEGLVTIEDILEELVGSEIHDEHDIEEEEYIQTQDKGWIVDAKMSIVDAEREFGIQIPHNPEYETLAGFISTKLGMIPVPGTVMYQDQFSIKVLASDKRQILKVKISPV